MKNKSDDKNLLVKKDNDDIIPISFTRKAWKVYLQVSFIGLIIAATMWYVLNTGSQIAKQYTPLIDAIIEIKYESTIAHLWFEEIISGDKNEDIETVWHHINKAEWYSLAMLEGGQKEDVHFIALKDPDLRIGITKILENIRAFRVIAKERYAQLNLSTVGSDIDQRFDFVFRSVLDQAENVETSLHQVIKKVNKRFETVQYALIVLCFLLAGFIGMILNRYKRHQEINMMKLKASNQELIASEQQLKATNQQLLASEQQLRATNQQLMASEQQLRDTNLHLLQSQQKLSLHVQQTPLGVIQWDLNFKVTEWNKSAENIFGFTYEEAIGQHASGLIVPDSAKDAVDKVWNNLLAQRKETKSSNENVTKNNKTIICEWYNTPLIDDEGKTIGVASLVLDVTKRTRLENTIRKLVEGTSSQSGRGFFESMAIHLAKNLDADYTFIGEFNKGQEDLIKTIAVTAEGKLEENIEYGLVDTPCENVMGKHACSYTSGVADQFPKDLLLKQMGVEGYVGVPLFDSKNKPLGILAALYRNPIDETDFKEGILKIFSSRIESEMERAIADKALRESESKLLKAQKLAGLGHYVFEVNSGNWTNSIELDILFGIDENFVRNLDGWLEIIHPDFKEIMLNYVQDDVLKQHNHFDKEYKIIDLATGQEKWVHGLGNLKFDNAGNPTEMFGTIQNITERKQAEEALLDSQERFKKLSNLTFEGIIIHNNGITVDVNESLTKLLGYSRNEIIGKNIIELCVPPEYHAAIQENIIKKETKPYELIAIKKDGTLIPVEVEARDIKGDDDELRVTAIRDISKRKQAEEELRDSEEKYRSLYEETPAMLHSIDKHGKIVSVTEKWLEKLGYTEDEVLGRKSTDFLTDKSKQFAIDEVLPNFFKTGHSEDIPYQYVKKNGDIIDVLLSATSEQTKDGKIVRSMASLIDITERKHAEEALLESEQNFRLLVENQNDMVVKVDTEGRFQFVSPSYCKVFGNTEDQLLGQKFMLKVHEDDHESTAKEMEKLYRPPHTAYVEQRAMTKDGWRWLGWMDTAVLDVEGNVTSIIGVGRDITDRKRAEQNTRDLANILERSLNEIYIFDTESLKFINVNFGARENIGYSLEELSKMTPLDIKPEFTRESFMQLIEPLKNNTKELISIEAVHKRKNGSTYDVDVHLQLSEFNGKSVLVEIILDITETKRLQKLESRAQRLEMAGTIAGQVAHDFNNLLGPIMAYPEFIRSGLPNDHPTLKYLDQIEKASIKIAEINQDLLAMGRRGHYNQKILNLNTIVQQTLTDLKPYPNTLTFDLNLNDDLNNFRGGGAQIHRMISNLLHNAKDAMQDIGIIDIKTENYYVDDVSIVYGRVPKGEYVKLTISDNGCGIPDDIVQKIFDPFFTSKRTNMNHGSGLGMSVVDAVIKDHKGFIDLSTKVGEGTSFYIYLPITLETVDIKDANKIMGGEESILVVDDDDIQREVSTVILTKLGYNVNSVESGEKAILFLRENPVELVILDMVMPGGIDGTETYRQILKVNSVQKAIILSGFSESSSVLEVQKLGAGAFVKKPVTSKTIAAAVRTELDRPKKISNL